MNIPFVNLAQQFLNLECELVDTFLKIGRSGVYIGGEPLESFEERASTFLGVSDAIGVGNGSDALFLILKALDIGPGDEVITATNSFIASAWVIHATGARPVLVDVDDDLNISPECIESAITKDTRAIIPVHLTGRPAPMNEINEIACKYGLSVVEDAAQAIGAKYYERQVGSLGDAAAFSLHPLKNLGLYGDGGLISTNNSELASKIRLLRNHGLKNRDECVMWGYNSRLDTLQAAFADIKLKYLEKWNNRCIQIANFYRNNITAKIIMPYDKPWEHSVYHNFVIRSNHRDELAIHLLKNGIETRIHYPIPIHLQECAINLGYKIGDFPNAENFCKTMLSLPIYPELSDAQLAYIIDKLNIFH